MQHLVLRIGVSPGIEKQCSDGDCIGVADRVVKGSLPTLSQHALSTALRGAALLNVHAVAIAGCIWVKCKAILASGLA